MDKDVEALLYKQAGVENHQAETDGQDVIGRPHPQKFTNRALQSVSLYPPAPTHLEISYQPLGLLFVNDIYRFWRRAFLLWAQKRRWSDKGWTRGPLLNSIRHSF